MMARRLNREEMRKAPELEDTLFVIQCVSRSGKEPDQVLMLRDTNQMPELPQNTHDCFVFTPEAWLKAQEDS